MAHARSDDAPRSWASSPEARRRMQANRRRDSAAEIAVRRAVHRRGLRYRVDAPIGPDRRLARPDLVFTRAKVAVFVDGCFWHGCPMHGTAPKANAAYWGPKLAANAERDRQTDARLRRAGWDVLRFWEHEDPEAAAERIAETVLARAAASSGPGPSGALRP